MHWNDWIGHMGWMWLWWILILVVLMLLVGWLLKHSSTGRPDRSPEQELKSRYARGEINREEYQRRLDDIRK